MKISWTQLQRLLSLLALSVIAVAEAIQPGLVGAAVNLGVVVLIGALFLFAPTRPSK